MNWNINNDNVVINGYDPVCWWEGKPHQGSSSHCCTYEGYTFWFCNEQNKITFESNPSKYVPQYGGWCAYGISQGSTCDVNPNCWIVSDDKLYIFANDECKSNWQSNQSACCATADANWSKGNLAAA